MNTLSTLKDLINSIFTTNGNKAITGEKTRTTLNTLTSALYLPAGFQTAWPGKADTIPEGWNLCNGSSFAIGDYPDLFAALGGYQSPYGVDVSAGTFQVPNISEGSSPVQCGTSSGYTLGATGGEKEHLLQRSELPKVRLKNGMADDQSSQLFVYGATTADMPGAANNTVTSEGKSPIYQGMTDYIGDDLKHNNMPPYIAQNFIIKLY